MKKNRVCPPKYQFWAPNTRFSASVQVFDGKYADCVCYGQISESTCSTFERALMEVYHNTRGIRAVVVDWKEIKYASFWARMVLFDFERRLRGLYIEIRLVVPRSPLTMSFPVTDFDRLLRVCESHEAAIADL